MFQVPKIVFMAAPRRVGAQVQRLRTWGNRRGNGNHRERESREKYRFSAICVSGCEDLQEFIRH